MREIKFRQLVDNAVMMEFCAGEVAPYPMCDNPIMQYTGLKDKNGVEIYEGDIIEIWSEHPGGDIGTTGEVKFYECQYWIDNNYGAIELFREDCQTEVKGNIHQNPELLRD